MPGKMAGGVYIALELPCWLVIDDLMKVDIHHHLFDVTRGSDPCYGYELQQTFLPTWL